MLHTGNGIIQFLPAGLLFCEGAERGAGGDIQVLRLRVLKTKAETAPGSLLDERQHALTAQGPNVRRVSVLECFAACGWHARRVKQRQFTDNRSEVCGGSLEKLEPKEKLYRPHPRDIHFRTGAANGNWE